MSALMLWRWAEAHSSDPETPSHHCWLYVSLVKRDNNQTSPKAPLQLSAKKKVCVPCLEGNDLTGFLLLSVMYHLVMKFSKDTAMTNDTSSLMFIQKQVSV